MRSGGFAGRVKDWHPSWNLQATLASWRRLKAVGIDLGTSNSAVAWMDAGGRTAMIRNIEGDLLTPSVVLFDDDGDGGRQGGPQRRDGQTRPGGPVGQARHGLPGLQPADPWGIPAPRGNPGLRLAEAQGRHRARPGSRFRRGHYGARLFRRAPPPGHGQRRGDGRPERAGHRQRAHGRRAGLRREPGLPGPGPAGRKAPCP